MCEADRGLAPAGALPVAAGKVDVAVDARDPGAYLSAMLTRTLHPDMSSTTTGWWWPGDVRTEVAPA